MTMKSFAIRFLAMTPNTDCGPFYYQGGIRNSLCTFEEKAAIYKYYICLIFITPYVQYCTGALGKRRCHSA